MFRKGRKRRNGFDAPYSRDQQIVSLLYILSTVANFCFICLALDENRYVFLGVSIAVTTVVLINWFHASSIDPELQGDETNLNFICGSSAERCNAYCIDCNKTIYQIDHHCSFLNTCIGGKNYLYFIVLILSGALQMILHIVVISFLMSHHDEMSFGKHHKHPMWPKILFISLQAVVSILLLFFLMNWFDFNWCT